MKILVRKSSFKIYEFQKLKTFFLLKQQEQVAPPNHTQTHRVTETCFFMNSLLLKILRPQLFHLVSQLNQELQVQLSYCNVYVKKLIKIILIYCALLRKIFFVTWNNCQTLRKLLEIWSSNFNPWTHSTYVSCIHGLKFSDHISNNLLASDSYSRLLKNYSQ